MTGQPNAPADDLLIWTAEGALRSRQFDDVYFSDAGGLDEARTVFLGGCGLPAAWLDRSDFTIGELGFGTGLNVLALLDLWRRTHAAGARLQVFSIEAFPLSAEQARRALELWPEIAELTQTLLARWPRRAVGFHRVDLPALGASLDLAVMDVERALDAWNGRADAWFLDGFSPSKNPQMWSESVLGAVARHSAPGARVATFTVAGAVRRGLEAQGFETRKMPGFGGKRERLEARMATPPRRVARPPSVAIVGAGVAGASL
ncbi:MAG TPA: tRNA (5-methylaminomethyl-2-thiouridine)(34)-methyltransferase MnmD, partial [Caulobacteraceae bacterium]|nr:tRNA (5-methylaminomethyl-2-thiouridine)(34)-methyltransferase MnmD [Caulobacteraceae bacterium]